jgi:hypothetical protein
MSSAAHRILFWIFPNTSSSQHPFHSFTALSHPNSFSNLTLRLVHCQTSEARLRLGTLSGTPSLKSRIQKRKVRLDRVILLLSLMHNYNARGPFTCTGWSLFLCRDKRMSCENHHPVRVLQFLTDLTLPAGKP